MTIQEKTGFGHVSLCCSKFQASLLRCDDQHLAPPRGAPHNTVFSCILGAHGMLSSTHVVVLGVVLKSFFLREVLVFVLFKREAGG